MSYPSFGPMTLLLMIILTDKDISFWEVSFFGHFVFRSFVFGSFGDEQFLFWTFRRWTVLKMDIKAPNKTDI